MKKTVNTIELWKGASPVDGVPIVALATGVYRPSTNSKTGPMIQVWIVPQAMRMTEARKLGLDRSVCGDCAFRSGACYVDQRPVNQVWQRWSEGKAESLSMHRDAFKGRAIRWGAFGDPALIPYDVVKEINGLAWRHTGYTHQWGKPWCDERFRALFMASVDNADKAVEASVLGWRTFRVVKDESFDIYGHKEIPCPADSGFGPIKTNCLACGLCDGAGDKASIVVKAHGGAVAKRVMAKILDV